MPIYCARQPLWSRGTSGWSQPLSARGQRTHISPYPPLPYPTLSSPPPLSSPAIISCFIDLAKSSSTQFNRYEESGHTCVFPDLSGIALSFSSFKLMFAMGLL
ncbi:hypothetical protein H671_4g11539 [Cricetulus griseus]|uniref:Uncharacterized protein n=1 Tax=Cricetulus griseus TaxID=10029 RepID=A0A061IBW2_CRIGR|nr:hypothetical protein H671_4g11539 [Cricetulus griseus]